MFFITQIKIHNNNLIIVFIFVFYKSTGFPFDNRLKCVFDMVDVQRHLIIDNVPTSSFHKNDSL